MQKLQTQKNSAEFNPCDVVGQSPKRATIDVVSAESRRPKLECLEEADFAELMKDGQGCMARHPMYTLLLAPPTTKDSAGTLWIMAKKDMHLDPHSVLFSFGPGRHVCLIA